jgi:hypothetical protein
MRDLAAVMTTDPSPQLLANMTFLLAAVVLIVVVEIATVVVVVTAKARARTTPTADTPTGTLDPGAAVTS